MSKFEIEGVVKYPPKGIGLKVEEVEKGKDGREFKTTHEVVCFDAKLFEGLEVGDRVKVTGNIGNKKSEFVRDGKYPVYLTRLYARAIVPADAAEVPRAAPARHRTERVKPSAPLGSDDDIPF